MVNKSQIKMINKISRIRFPSLFQTKIIKSKDNAKLAMKVSHKRYSRTIEEAFQCLNQKIIKKHLLC